MIDKKTKGKMKELHNTTLSTLALAALCQKVEEPAPSHMGKGHIWKHPSQNRSRRISPRPAKPPPGQAYYKYTCIYGHIVVYVQVSYISITIN